MLPAISQQAFTTKLNGIPIDFTKFGGNGRSLLVQKGQLNKFKLRPQILNEHAESTREIQDVINATTIVGQVFRASQDTINGIVLTMESAAGAVLDDFESYANSAALQAVWVKNGTNLAVLETTILPSGGGLQAMNLPLDTVDDEWIDTVGSTDYTGFTGTFDFRQSVAFAQAKVSVFIGDGTNTKSIQIPIADANAWKSFAFEESAMSEDQAGTTNVAAITKIGFRVDSKRSGADAYVDNLIATPAPGSVDVKLWDFGADIPVTAVSKLDDATQYIELGDRGINSGAVVASINVALSGGKRNYQVNQFVAGAALEIPANTLLNDGNYYAITVHYVDTDVSIYGPDTAYGINYYSNGFAFFAPNTATAITAIGANSDLGFQIFSIADICIESYSQLVVTSAGEFSDPGSESKYAAHIEDSNMGISTMITSNVPTPHGSAQFDFAFRPLLMEKGGKFEVYLSDDAFDDVQELEVTIKYLYKPPVVYG